MRKRPEWLTQSDDAILEYLADCSVALSARGLEINMSRELETTPSKRTIRRRLSALSQHQFIETADENGVWYVLTDRGRAYLAGDFDVDDLESND